MSEPMSDLVSQYEAHGFVVAKKVIPLSKIEAARREIAEVGSVLVGQDFTDIDEMYSVLKQRGDNSPGVLYDGCKRLVWLNSIAFEPSLIKALQELGCRAPANIDINFRIDSKSREKFAFDWHQDYWFSVSSKNAIVAWIPLTDVTEETGGLSLISTGDTDRKIFSVKAGDKYNSYADAVLLDEEIPEDKALPMTCQAGDALLFRFDVLHKSLPVLSALKSRWTLQARFSDFHDAEFRNRGYRPASVTPGNIPYLAELAAASEAKNL